MENKFDISEIKIKEELRKYFSRLLLNVEPDDEQNILELGLVHSLFAIQLIIFIEKEFGIELDDEEIDLKNVTSINAISQMIIKKLRA
jgi:methoxymalonate biosynthesis acyl carrier protein